MHSYLKAPLKLGLLLSLISYLSVVSASSEFWPGTVYDENIPTLEAVIGHENGEQITAPPAVTSYLKALAKAAPERTKLVQYATSWEGRPLHYLVISSATNIEGLKQNQQNMQKLADPRRYSEAEAAGLVTDTLPVSWLSYGVHGDEISSTDAGLLSAYHLLAAQNDETVDNILNNSIVVIDPSQNPDGRARFVAHYQQNRGLEPAVHWLAAEHRQAWPGGRTNHYLFDMNRDWFAQTQPETQGRIKHYLEFHPVVHADIHEMGVDQSYYFPPPAEPYNPHISESQKQNLILYGKGNAEAFDDFNFDYFTREVFDAHYAGYGDTWPAFHGAIGMTFEVSSARGLVQRKSSGELVTYRNSVHRHFVASVATMLTTATNGDKLLTDLATYRRDALEAEQHYFFSGDQSLTKKLMGKLEAQGIEVHQLRQSSRACGKSRSAGSYVVKAGQPGGNLVRTLLDADSPIASEFWAAKEKDRARGLPVNLYDVLAWSMPALYGLGVDVCSKSVADIVRADLKQTVKTSLGDAKFGYLVENNTSASMAFLASALRQGLVVDNVDASFSIADKEFPRGTLLIRSADTDQSVHETVRSLASNYEVELTALDSSWTDAGTGFGSGNVQRLNAPQIAIAWDAPTNPNAAGHTRFVVEQALDYPTTTVRVDYLGDPELDYFDVLILPDGGNYVGALGASGLANLKGWVERGGVLITMGAATKLLIDESFAVLASNLEANVESTDQPEVEGVADASIIESDDDYLELLSSSATKPDYVPGVIANAVVDKQHWLAAGVASQLHLVLDGRDIYTPLKQGEGTNVVRFAAETEVLNGGYLWQENRAQLAYKPAVMVAEYGTGTLIGFTVDPTFRGFMDGLHVILANAIFKAPAR